jgi:Flp pilus assembly protein TadD
MSLARRVAPAVLSMCFAACGSGPSSKTHAAASAPLPEDDGTAGGTNNAPARAVPQASSLVKQGEAKLQAQDAPGAQALFEQAISADPKDARARLDLGIARELQEDTKGAEAAYRAAIELQPDLAEALNNLGVLLRDRGELDQAIDVLGRAARANPQSASAQANLGLALEDHGDAAGAERAYRAAIDIDPKAVMTRVNLGLLLIGRGDEGGAREQLGAALQGAQGNRPALVAIGNGLRRAGDAQGALQAMQAAVQGSPPATPAVRTELALAQRAAGDRDGAIATLEKVIAENANYATAHYVLGNMLAAEKRTADARKHFERYLALEPKGAQAAQARERLKVLKGK